MIPVLLACGLARAEGLLVAGGAGGSGATPAQDTLGVSLLAGWLVAPAWTLEAQVDGAWTFAPGLRVDGLVGGRWFPGGVWGEGPTPSVRLAGGAAAGAGGLRPSGLAGAALDLPSGPRFALRVGADLRVDGDGTLAALVGLGARLGGPPPPPPPPVVEPPSVSPSEALVWVPHPVCEWVPPAEVAERLRSVPPHAAVTVAADGYVPQVVPLAAVDGVDLAPVPRQGAVVLVGYPGDRLELAGQGRPAGEDGVTILNAPVGDLEVVVVGGGRRVALTLAVDDGYVAWQRVPAPGPVTIPFAQDSALLTPEAEAVLTGLARDAGAWSFEVYGDHSPEGTPERNVGLAGERAEVVRAALVARGVPEAALAVVTAPDAAEGDPTSRRRAVVRPVAGGAR